MESRVFLDSFTLAWEQRKLDTITDVRDGTHDSPQYVELGHPFITSKNVKDGFINYEDIQYVSDKDYEEINKRSKVDKNDILMGMIGTIGNIALVRETPDFAIKNVALIKDIGDVYYRYLYHCLQSNSIAHQLDENLDGGTQKFIALNKIRELVIPVPSDHEQQKIGDYMESLDNLITLHQCKESAFSEWKDSGFLQKHKTTWEQRKAKELCSISTGKSNTQDRIEDGKYPFYVRSPIVERSNRYLFDEEAVLTVGDGVGTGKVFHYVNGKYDLHQRVYRMFGFSEEISAKYFYYYFSNHFYDRVMAMTAKTSVDSVRYEMIADMEISLPNKQEQICISMLFEQLDNLITLHQRKPFCINRRQKWKQTTKMQNYSANIMQNGFQYIRKGR